MQGLYINYKYLPISLAIYKVYKVYMHTILALYVTFYVMCYVLLYNLDIKQMLLYDEVIKLTCIYKGLILANNI